MPSIDWSVGFASGMAASSLFMKPAPVATVFIGNSSSAGKKEDLRSVENTQASR